MRILVSLWCWLMGRSLRLGGFLGLMLLGLLRFLGVFLGWGLLVGLLSLFGCCRVGLCRIDVLVS